MARVRGTSRKRKCSNEDIPDGLGNDFVDTQAGSKKRAKRSAVTADAPTAGLAKKLRNRVFEAIYRDLFEQIGDRATGPSPKGGREVEAIEGAQEKFVEVCPPPPFYEGDRS